MMRKIFAKIMRQQDFRQNLQFIVLFYFLRENLYILFFIHIRILTTFVLKSINFLKILLIKAYVQPTKSLDSYWRYIPGLKRLCNDT